MDSVPKVNARIRSRLRLNIGSGARIAGKSGVMRDVEPGGAVGGYPAIPLRQWHRQTAGLFRLFTRKDKQASAKDPSGD